MTDVNYFDKVIEWIISNRGYSFYLHPQSSLSSYTDAYGVNRPLTYHGAKDHIKFKHALKLYIECRMNLVDEYPEITFNKTFEIVKIGLI